MIHQLYIPANANNGNIQTNFNGQCRIKIKNVYFVSPTEAQNAAAVLAGDPPLFDDSVVMIQSNIFSNVQNNRLLVGLRNNNQNQHFNEIEFVAQVNNNIHFTLLDAVTFGNIYGFNGCIITLDIEH